MVSAREAEARLFRGLTQRTWHWTVCEEKQRRLGHDFHRLGYAQVSKGRTWSDSLF